MLTLRRRTLEKLTAQKVLEDKGFRHTAGELADGVHMRWQGMQAVKATINQKYLGTSKMGVTNKFRGAKK